MRYLGGKSRIAKHLIEYMAPTITERGSYVEPFIGGANVISKVKCPERLGSDKNEALVTMWQELQRGWDPPSAVTEERYLQIKAKQDPWDPLTAFLGFGCSFGGMWFSSFARDKIGTNYAAGTRNSLIKKMKGLRDVHFMCGDYADLPYPPNAVVYCDPPYAETTGYEAVGAFDSKRFWSFVRKLEASGRPVFVSEYAAPADFDCVLEIPTKLGLHGADGVHKPRIEKLFRWRDAWMYS